MNKLSKKFLIYNAIVVALSVLSITIGFCVSLFGSEEKVEVVVDGSVGLRSYFHAYHTIGDDGKVHSGDGTKEYPYVITRPLHFYNLTRLQNLGVFGTQKYFSLGYDLDNSGVLKFYKSDTSNELNTYLDMTTSSNTNVLTSIGSEGSPFVGYFNGNSLTIHGLHISSAPEDVGVFGYIGEGGKVHDVSFSDLIVSNDGYEKQILDDFYIDGLGNSCYLTYEYQKATGGGNETIDVPLDLENADSITGVKLDSNYLLSTRFLPTFSDSLVKLESDPKNNVNLIIRPSNDLLVFDKDNKLFINIDLLNSEKFDKFRKTDDAIIATSIYMIATKLANDGFTYSKVLTSYTIKFHNKIDPSLNSIISTYIFRDFVKRENSAVTQYHHGNNIGYIAGHCDGRIENVFVYNGSIVLNNGNADYGKIKAESSIGLVGEVGVNIENDFSPSGSQAGEGDTGVINFTHMYDSIRLNNSYSSASGTNSLGQEVTFYNYTHKTRADGNLFLDYLRPNTNRDGYISSASNSIDFKGQQYVKDTSNEDRGMGVFGMTSDNSNNLYNIYDGIGSFSIYKSLDAFNEFYYSTAEFTNSDDTTPIYQWSDAISNKYALYQGVDAPSYVDNSTWNKNMESYYSYYFKSPLVSDSLLKGNYFSNSDSIFLQEYFRYKIKDKNGDSFDRENSSNGVLIKDVNPENNEASNIISFDSYLGLTEVESEIETMEITENSVTSLLPLKSVNFSVSNKNGANVTVLASNQLLTNKFDHQVAYTGKGQYVSIYKKDKSIGENKISNSGNIPLTSMFLPYNMQGSHSTNSFAYFNYDPITGTTDTKATFEDTIDSKLFAHTFRLEEPGEYFIGSPNGNVALYYVCAQGQEAGNTGSGTVIYDRDNFLKNIDFLLYDPKNSNYKNLSIEERRAYFSLELIFDNTPAELDIFKVSCDDVEHKLVINKPSNLMYIMIKNNNKLAFEFDGVNSSDKYFEWRRA